MNEKRKRDITRSLAEQLYRESLEWKSWAPSGIDRLLADPQASANDVWLAVRALMNVRPAVPAPPEFLALQDELLQALIAEDGIAYVSDTQPAPAHERIRLWRGDITRLAADAIVNAANSGMTGCWAPLHYCIDNAIHTFAGVQLRAECAALIQAQGHEEPTARAQVTDAYNLPSKQVIHTVGPIANGRPTSLHRAQLAQCYRACLNAAAEHGARSIAFCCISTGVFGFPQDEAAVVAVRTVEEWLDEHPEADITVVFNVFGDVDEHLYRELLGLKA